MSGWCNEQSCHRAGQTWVGSTEHREDEEWVFLLKALVMQRAEQEPWHWSTQEGSETKDLIASQQGGGMTSVLRETWRVPNLLGLTPLGFVQAEYQPPPGKSPGEMLRRLHTSAPTCTRVRVHAGGDGRRFCSPSSFHPLSQSLFKREEKLRTSLLAEQHCILQTSCSAPPGRAAWLIALVSERTSLMTPELAATGLRP